MTETKHTEEYMFEHSCRTCSKLFHEDEALVPIFDGFEVHTITDDKFSLITELISLDIQIQFNDGLPQKICLNCVEKVSRIFLFRNLCKTSLSVLKNIFQSKNFKIQKNNMRYDNFQSQIIKYESAYDNATMQENIPIEINKFIISEQNITSAGNNNDDDDDDEEFINFHGNVVKGSDIKKDNKITQEEDENYFINDGYSYTPINFSPINSSFNNKKPEKIIENNKKIINKQSNIKNVNYISQELKYIENNEIIPSTMGISDSTFIDEFFKSIEENLECLYTNQIDNNEVQELNVINNNNNNNNSNENCINNINTTEIDQTISTPISLSSSTVTETTAKTTTKKPDRIKLKFDNNKSQIIIAEKCLKCNKYAYKNLKHGSNLCDRIKPFIDSKKYCCYYCNELFNTKSLLRIHFLRLHPSIKPYACKICGGSFSNITQQHEHIETIHKDINDNDKKLYQCLICMQYYISRQTLFKHEKCQHIQELNECKQCNKKFLTRLRYRVHMRLHKIIKQFKCDYCFRTFDDNFSKLRHIKISHKNIKYKYKCNYCIAINKDKRFRTEQGLRHHITLIHKTEYLNEKYKNDNIILKTQEIDDEINMKLPSNLKRCIKCYNIYYKNLNKKHDKLCNGNLYEKPMKNYCCLYCNYLTNELNDIIEHIHNIHDNNKPYTCLICKNENDKINEIFKTSRLYDIHLRKKHKDIIHELYKCNICDKNMSSIVNVIRHKQRFHITIIKECKICGKKYRNQPQYKYHLKTHCDKKKYACNYCDKSFLQKHHLNNHELVHTNYKSYECDICHTKFKHKQKFDLHIKKHNGCKPFLCNICAKSFTKQILLKKHLETHDLTPKYKCEDCGERYHSRSSYYKHRNVKHLDKKYNRYGKSILDEKCICPICSKIFALPLALQKHMNSMHDRTRKYKCSQCENFYSKTEHLKVHIRKDHTNERPYNCEYCDKKFFDSSSRNVHVKTHLEVPPTYKCEICDKSYRTACSLRFHKMSHTGAKPFKCSICEANFKYYVQLKAHYLKHSKEERENDKKKVLEGINGNIEINNLSSIIKQQTDVIETDKKIKIENLILQHEMDVIETDTIIKDDNSIFQQRMNVIETDTNIKNDNSILQQQMNVIETDTNIKNDNSILQHEMDVIETHIKDNSILQQDINVMEINMKDLFVQQDIVDVNDTTNINNHFIQQIIDEKKLDNEFFLQQEMDNIIKTDNDFSIQQEVLIGYATQSNVDELCQIYQS